jgi:hypothetical protein
LQGRPSSPAYPHDPREKNTLAAKRRAFAILCDHKLVSALFNTVALRFKTRQGGYTRIIKFAVNRPGDNAEMVLLELTEKDLATFKPAQAKEGVQDAKGAAEEAQVVEKKADEKKAKSKKAKEDKGKAKK